MAKAKNRVVGGDYMGSAVSSTLGMAFVQVGFFKTMELTPKTVSGYELVTDEHRKSAASGAARGLVGGALLGPVGLLAGGISAKSKGIYQVVIQFKDGKSSLLEVDDKIYKSITTKLALVNAANSSAGSTASAGAISTADEIMKFKQLLDAGVITQKEFDEQKAKLLK